MRNACQLLLFAALAIMQQVVLAKSHIDQILEQTPMNGYGIFELTEKTFDNFVSYNSDLVLVCFFNKDQHDE